jgi:hypothetical protein
MRRQFLLALLLVVGWGVVSPVRAATPAVAENMTVSPTQLRLELSPGATTSGHITVINDSDSTYDFKAYAAAYRVAGEGYTPSFRSEPGGSDASGWVKLGAQTYHIEPRQSLTVPYTITVPAGLGGGGYYATLFYETIPKPSGGSGVQSKTRVGVVAYLKIRGEVVERGSLESFTARFLQKGTPVMATLRLGNQGNVHYPADVTMRATDVFGQTKTELRVNREVLPGTIRRFDLAWERAPVFGLFRLGGSVDMLGRTESLPGQYVLILAPVAFWSLLGALALLAIVAWWWWLGRRRS